MPKYLLMANAGYGEDYQVVDCATEEEAQTIAYEMWREAAESQADYFSTLLTPELAEAHGFEDELEDEESNEASA